MNDEEAIFYIIKIFIIIVLILCVVNINFRLDEISKILRNIIE